MAREGRGKRAATGVAVLLLASLPFHSLSAQDTASDTAAAAPLQIHFVNNFSQTFAVPLEFLWAELKRMYVDGNKYRDLGFTVEMIAPVPEAPLGGTVVVQHRGSGEADRITALFSAIDDASRFLALRATYSTGATVHASYAVRPAPSGSQVQLVVHALQPWEGADSHPTADDARRAAERLTAFHYGQLAETWAAEARRVEARYRALIASPH
jgi:hypothetical protein